MDILSISAELYHQEISASIKKNKRERLGKDNWSEVVEILLFCVFWAVVGICCAGQIWVMLLKCCVCCIS